jgi:guanine nucleotide-binding protein G(i) subunit alpha
VTLRLVYLCVTSIWADRSLVCSLFDRAHWITARGYIPSDEDILRAAEEPVVGVRETSFVVDQLTIQLCDVGGQLNERKKWIHQFEGVTGVIFCVSLSDYDQVLYISLIFSKGR